MKYTTFRTVVAIASITIGLFAIFEVHSCCVQKREREEQATQQAAIIQERARLIQVEASRVAPEEVHQVVTVAPHRATDVEIQSVLGAWLGGAGRDRHGQNKLVDIFPGATFRATAIRFRESDATRWSNDSAQWSQIKLDLNRDGVDDVKILLKNGQLYKKEVLLPSGQTASTSYFVTN